MDNNPPESPEDMNDEYGEPDYNEPKQEHSSGEASPNGTDPSGSLNRSGAPLQKRRRVTRACDECRRKKIKCDGKQPCTHCTVYSYGKSISPVVRTRQLMNPLQTAHTISLRTDGGTLRLSTLKVSKPEQFAPSPYSA